MGTLGGDFELERLRAELAQERQMKEMLDKSTGELQLTVEELDKRFDGIDDENNEWKTRYETQVEVNEQLEKQIIVLRDKVDEARKTLKETRMPKSVRNIEDLSEVTPHIVRQLQKEKDSLASQLRDLEWRLDQESKAYHKANEDRKQYVTEINDAKKNIDAVKTRGAATSQQQAESLSLTPRGPVSTQNIPQDQRILDPRRGPIKKTAAVKNLPKLE